jgi:tetratricopeptide (TPR) repeat protein
MAPYRSTVRRLAEALMLSEEASDELAASARRPVKDPSGIYQAVTKGGFLGAMPTTRLVARGEESRRILDALEASEGGSGRLVLLAGEPGIGKTRLAQEATIHAWGRRFVVAAGRCYESQSGVPFYPFLDALCTLYDEAPPAIRKAIPERWPYLTRLLPDHFPSRSLTSSEGQEESQRLLRAVTGFVREVSSERSVALLLDDLHFMDGASMNLLAHLSRHTREDRVLLLGTYRDVEVGHGHPLRKAARELEREQLVEKIVVRRLGREATAMLMSDWLDGAEVSKEFVTLVYSHTEGNPFFIVEVLKALIERGDLSRWEGRWVRKEIEDLATPESVSEAISERVSRLQPRTREALEGASVLGQVFDFEDLMAVVRLDEEEIERALEEAEASGLVRTAMDGYAFDHALTQQTLYAGLSHARRRRLHRSAGEGLEKLGNSVRQKRVAEISRHFVQGGSPTRALPYALLAGDEAGAVFAHGEAERHYRSALELAEKVGDGPAAAQALEKLGSVLATSVRYDEALAALERAAQIHRAGNDPEAAGRVEASIAQTHFRRGTHDEGASRLASYLESLDKPGASEGVRRSLAALYGALARLYYARSQFAECRDAAERGAGLSRAVEDFGLFAEAQMMRGTALLWLEAPDEGVTNLEEAVRLAERSGTLDTLSTALLPLYLAYMVRGEFDRSRQCSERGAAIAEKTGDTDLLAMHTTNLGLQRFYLGDWREAREHLELAVGLSRSTQLSYFSSLPPAYLGVLRKAEGSWEDATRCLSDAVALAQQAGNQEVLRYAESRLAELDVLRGRPAEAITRLGPLPDLLGLTWWYDVLSLSVLAEGYAETGNAARAEEVAHLALMRARHMQNRVDGVEALRVRGKILSMGGRQKEATAALEQALSWACYMPYPYAEAKLWHEYAMLHVREGAPGRARERISKALEIFGRLGAKKDIEQTRRTLRNLGRA